LIPSSPSTLWTSSSRRGSFLMGKWRAHRSSGLKERSGGASAVLW